MNEEIQQTCAIARKVFVAIGCIHLVLLVGCLLLVWQHYLDVIFLHTDDRLLIAQTTAIVSLIGGLLYFSRKVYSYLISDKLGRLAREFSKESAGDENALHSSIKNSVMGYYFYLGTRPIASVVVGPILLLLVMGGMTTFSKTGTDTEFSHAGTILVFALSFIGGYSSSNLFDFFSRLGDKLIDRMGLDQN